MTLARPALVYGPAPTMPEALLVRGLGGIAPRRETCACGGSIAVRDATDPSEVAAAVAAHQASRRHAGWREEAGL